MVQSSSFIFIVLGAVAKFCGFSVWAIIKILKDELILAYSTASSETVLPRIMEKMEAYGAPKPITSFVIQLAIHLTSMVRPYIKVLRLSLLLSFTGLI